MIFFYIRVAIYIGYVVALLATSTKTGVGPRAWVYIVVVFVLSQLSYLAEAGVGRWQTRRAIRDVLSLDPAARGVFVDRVWLGAAREQLRQASAKAGDVDVDGTVERYPFPAGDRTLASRVFWALGSVAVAFAAAAAGVIPLNGTARWTLVLVASLLGAILLLVRRRDRHLATVLEITPFGIAEIATDGSRRSLSWVQALELRNRPWLGRVELSPIGGGGRIDLDYDRIGMQRALQKTLAYGGFKSP